MFIIKMILFKRLKMVHYQSQICFFFPHEALIVLEIYNTGGFLVHPHTIVFFRGSSDRFRVQYNKNFHATSFVNDKLI